MGAFAYPRGYPAVPPATAHVTVPVVEELDKPAPMYWGDLIQCVRSDGGWLCIHQNLLELCSVCILFMDIRYRRLEQKL